MPCVKFLVSLALDIIAANFVVVVTSPEDTPPTVARTVVVAPAGTSVADRLPDRWIAPVELAADILARKAGTTAVRTVDTVADSRAVKSVARSRNCPVSWGDTSYPEWRKHRQQPETRAMNQL